MNRSSSLITSRPIKLDIDHVVELLDLGALPELGGTLLDQDIATDEDNPGVWWGVTGAGHVALPSGAHWSGWVVLEVPEQATVDVGVVRGAPKVRGGHDATERDGALVDDNIASPCLCEAGIDALEVVEDLLGILEGDSGQIAREGIDA
jgi:hypothetical protein